MQSLAEILILIGVAAVVCGRKSTPVYSLGLCVGLLGCALWLVARLH